MQHAKVVLLAALVVGALAVGLVPAGPAAAAPMLPGAPVIDGVTGLDGAIEVAVSVPDTGGDTIVALHVHCTSSGGPDGFADGPTSPLTVSGLTNGVDYQCTATAENSVGTGPTSTPSGPVTPTSGAGAIAGTITTETGAPPTGYCAVASPPADLDFTHVTPVASDGTYVITSLPPAPYAVLFWDCANAGTFLPQWYDGKPIGIFPDPDSDGATPVIVSAGATTAGIDGELAVGARVSGTVTDGSGTPVAGICAALFAGGTPAAVGFSTPAGTYGLIAPAGTYTVQFIDCPGNGWLPQWWDHADSADAAVPLTLAAGATVGGIDAALRPGGSISGTVTATGGAPLDEICVSALEGTHGGSTRTQPDGTYTIVGLPPGSAYAVAFTDCRVTPVYAGTSFPGPVAVSVGATTTGIDAVLSPGPPGRVAGTITRPDGTPLAGVCVAVLPPASEPWFGGPTGSDGTYAVDGVASGRLFVGFFGCDQNDPLAPIVDPDRPGVTYAPVWYDGVPLGVPDPVIDGATPVTVPSGGTAVVDQCLGDCAGPVTPMITIDAVVPGPGSATVYFTSTLEAASGAASVAASFTYTARCTSGTGVTGSAFGPGSPITVSGLTGGATYTCTVSADFAGVTVSSGASAPIVAQGSASDGPTAPTAESDPRGTLPRTGAPLGRWAGAGLGLLAAGGAASLVGGRRRRPLGRGSATA